MVFGLFSLIIPSFVLDLGKEVGWITRDKPQLWRWEVLVTCKQKTFPRLSFLPMCHWLHQQRRPHTHHSLYLYSRSIVGANLNVPFTCQVLCPHPTPRLSVAVFTSPLPFLGGQCWRGEIFRIWGSCHKTSTHSNVEKCQNCTVA